MIIMATEYSAEWVKVPDGNGGTKKVWLRDSKARKTLADKFATIDGTFAASAAYTGYTNYPTGFTSENCAILSLSAKRSNLWRSGDGFGSGSAQTFAQLGTTGIRVYNSASDLFSLPWRIVLMRIDI